jgi:hypothetical protein
MSSREKHFHFARGVLYSIGLAALVAGAGCSADTSGSFDGAGGRGSERGVHDSASEVEAAVPWGKGEDCRPWGCAEKASERQSALSPSSPALACSSPAQCASGFCVDGVCCDTACTGSCEACSASKKGQGADGTCGVIALYADPDNECDDGACDGSGSCKKYNGATCGATTECLSGNCADGFCCGAPCTETCRACSIAKRGGGFDGQCGPIAAGTDPDNECDSGECNGAAACTLPKPLANGVICIESSQCTSGNCVDGVCCDTACSGTCQACTAVKKGQGADGTCGPIAANQDPDDECLDGVCTGAETCIKFNGATCSSPDECLSGYCADGYCCGAACTESCRACSADKKGGGVNGQCGPIAAGTDPDNECDGGECNGAAACTLVSGATCIDGVKNGNETDVDCGGGTCVTCGIGKTCNVAADCATNQCLGGTCVAAESGCSDGQREGYIGSPNIAACSGGWSVPGVTVASPSCNHNAGDDSANPAGTGCSVADLCEVGWHVCAGSAEVVSKSDGLNCNGDLLGFFATRQSGPGWAICGAGNNDLFGCGSIGATPGPSCGVLNRFSNDLCINLGAPWSCGSDGYQEAANVTKNGSAGGGVLCCRDTNLPVNLANGDTCAENSQCASGHCVDGVCCDTACSGTCTACNVPGSVGTCANVPQGQTDANASNPCAGVCDGQGVCYCDDQGVCGSNAVPYRVRVNLRRTGPDQRIQESEWLNIVVQGPVWGIKKSGVWSLSWLGPWWFDQDKYYQCAALQYGGTSDPGVLPQAPCSNVWPMQRLERAQFKDTGEIVWEDDMILMEVTPQY